MVGLTGGIGAGKSAAAGALAELGAVVIDADRLAREVVEPGTDGLAEVVAAFGSEVLGPDGALDRSRLGETVFADDDARRRLEAIIHPRVAARTADLIAAAPDSAIVVYDVPLLVENDLAPAYHLVVVVDAPVDVRMARLAAHRGMSADTARARIAAQATDERRAEVADVILDNSGTPEQLAVQVGSLWRDRLVPYEANVRQRRVVRRPAEVRLAPADPTWPAQYERLAVRLRRVLGERAVTVDHIGSTAIPGLLAKDVIDLQVGVPDLALVDESVDELAAAGFPPLPGEWFDNPKSVPAGDAPDAATSEARSWPKRLHGGADPARVVHVHLRVVGSPGWRYARLFRDWLRACPEPRERYAAEKLRLAGLYRRTEEYAEAKEPWFDRAWPEAEKWAKSTGWQPGDTTG